MKLSQFSGMLLIEANGQSIHMDVKEQRELVKWLWVHRKDLIADVVA